jgi:hypothetical protein
MDIHNFCQKIEGKKRLLGRLGVGGSILKWVLKQCDIRVWTELCGSWYGPVLGPCEHSYLLLGYMGGGSQPAKY